MSRYRCFVRSLVTPLAVTGVCHSRFAVQLPPEICWAAFLAEGELVDVVKTSTGQSFQLPVEIGADHAVVFPQSLANYLRPGDALSLLSFSLVRDETSAEQVVTYVDVGTDNVPIAIRTRAAQQFRVHPSYLIAAESLFADREFMDSAAPR